MLFDNPAILNDLKLLAAVLSVIFAVAKFPATIKSIRRRVRDKHKSKKVQLKEQRQAIAVYEATPNAWRAKVMHDFATSAVSAATAILLFVVAVLPNHGPRNAVLSAVFWIEGIAALVVCIMTLESAISLLQKMMNPHRYKLLFKYKLTKLELDERESYVRKFVTPMTRDDAERIWEERSFGSEEPL